MSIKSLAKAFVGVAVVSLWGLAPGCGASIGGYCNKACDCVGCSESEREGCVDTLEDVKDAAEDEGCGSEFDDLLSCANSELECDDGLPSSDGCESEAEALNKCADGSGSGPGPGPSIDACQVYTDDLVAHYESCGVTVEDPGQPSECSDQLAELVACYTPCTDLLTCGCVTGSDCPTEDSQPYADCVAACN